MHDFNNVFTSEMVDHLFKKEDEETGVETGMDIVALNVQRGRDHQMPTYPAYRYAIYFATSEFLLETDEVLKKV